MCSWQRATWPKCPAIIAIDSAMYLFTISSPDIDKVAMSLYDIINRTHFSIVDTTVLYREVALIQRQIRARLYVFGMGKHAVSSLERCPVFRASFIERFSTLHFVSTTMVHTDSPLPLSTYIWPMMHHILLRRYKIQLAIFGAEVIV